MVDLVRIGVRKMKKAGTAGIVCRRGTSERPQGEKSLCVLCRRPVVLECGITTNKKGRGMEHVKVVWEKTPSGKFMEHHCDKSDYGNWKRSDRRRDRRRINE